MLAGQFLNQATQLPAVGKVTISSKVRLTSSTSPVIVESIYREIVLDVTGSFAIELPVCDDPDWSPVGWSYGIEISIAGNKVPDNYTFSLAYAGPDIVYLSTVLDSGAVVGSGSSYILKTARNAPNGVAGLDSTSKLILSQLPTLALQGLVLEAGQPVPGDTPPGVLIFHKTE
jgi:hypothetical protein